MKQLKIKQFLNIELGYKSKIAIIIIGSVASAAFLYFTNQMAREIKEKEQKETKLWTRAVTIAAHPGDINTSQNIERLLDEIINREHNISFIVTQKDLSVIDYQNIDREIINNPELLRKELEDMTNDNEPIQIEQNNRNTIYIFYKDSPQLVFMKYIPYVQLLTLIILIILISISYYSSRNNEQNRIWVGMAKETAHQLGTPSSSLLGWLEHLKNENINQEIVEEIGKDISRLLTVVDRFSKIGSVATLRPKNVTEIMANTIEYFQMRKPKKVTITSKTSDIKPIIININAPLFAWVMENMIKNAIDALGGEGEITVIARDDPYKVIIDIKDTGKGIAKSNFKNIFKPGFSTKTRGWGLGLSLCKRIVEGNHEGKLFVAESEVGKGTTMRIELKKM